jgi:putative endonuclease
VARKITKLSNTRQFGFCYERRACRYLQRQGLALLQRNFQCRYGEIDLVLQDPSGFVVFAEIRYRRSREFGGAAASVDWRKQQRLRRSAACFLNQFPTLAHHPCRFDVIAMQPDGVAGEPSIDWIKQAFT